MSDLFLAELERIGENEVRKHLRIEDSGQVNSERHLMVKGGFDLKELSRKESREDMCLLISRKALRL